MKIYLLYLCCITTRDQGLRVPMKYEKMYTRFLLSLKAHLGFAGRISEEYKGEFTKEIRNFLGTRS